MRKILCLAVFAMLTACTSTPASDIAVLEATLSAADTAALAYVKLPTCSSTSSPLCKTTATVVKIGQAASVAYIAVKAAETAQTQTAIQQAQTAVTAFQSIVSSLNTGS